MKKFLSLIAVVATVCSMATNAFAFSCAGQVTGATLKDVTTETATIEYDETNTDGFVFKFFVDENLSKSTTSIDVSKLTAAGWTIEAVDGLFAFTSGYTLTNTTSKLSVKFADGVATITPEDAVIQFKAVPGDAATIDGVTFTVSPMYNTTAGLYRTTTTYTLAKAAPAVVDKVTTEDTLTDGEGVVEFTYDESYEGNKAFEGKKVIFQNVETTRGNIKADTKVKVTRKSTNEVKYFGEKLYANWGVEGEGELAAKTIAFGLVIDAELDAADFEFVIE